MGGELKQRGMKADRITLAFEHGTFQVVVEYDPGQPLPELERRLMAAQEVGHLRIEEEAQEDRPREAQHHDEGHQGALGLANGELSEVSPVHLGLLAR